MNEWNLELIYPSYEEFSKDLDSIYEDIKEIEALKNTLNNKEGFLKYIEVDRKVNLRISKLFTYASMKFDLNQKDNDSMIDYQKVYQAYNDLVAKSAFINPEILANGKEKVLSIIDSSKQLEVIRYSIDRLFRNKDFILDEKSEGLMANYEEATSEFNNLYDKLAVTDNNSVNVVLSNGEKLELNESNFQYYLGILENQEDRRIVFEAIYKFYENHKNTFAAIYAGIMKSEMVNVKNRGYKSILDSHLYSNRIPSEVVYSLIDTAKNNSNVLKKYLNLRKKFFNLKEYHTYDRFLDFAKSDTKYTYDESKRMVLEACEAFGDDFYNHAVKALEDGRVSVNIKDGKRTGAYSTSLYNEGAFILLNHNDNLNSAFTIAHEAGHSIHSLYANEAQPVETSNYTIFVAEIASTLNEQLFLDYVMKNSKNKDEKIVVLQTAIDNIVSTFYRQTLFANFEVEAHKLVENKIPVTAEALGNIMEELYMSYYGIDLKNEPYKNNVWAYIPHFFHTPFYVYQYATSFAASMAIYEKIKNNEPNALNNYINMLKMGGSTYPVDIVKTAGVDLTKTDAFMAVVNRFEELLVQLEDLLK